MHDTALAIGRMFFELYGDRPGLRVVELGSQDVNGSFREVLPESCSYVGVDLEPGKNVDLVCRGTHIALPDERPTLHSHRRSPSMTRFSG